MAELARHEVALKAWAANGAQGPRPNLPNCPQYLELYLTCRDWQTLPYTGGLMEQPYLLFHFMQTAGDAYNLALAEHRRAQELMRQLQEQQKHG